MNLSELIEDNKTVKVADVDPLITVKAFSNVCRYICLALGIPGNVLSATVWLRLHVARKNSSAVYLAALAISDLVYLLSMYFSTLEKYMSWIYYCVAYLGVSASTLEPLFVLAFSVERLIAICWPLQVWSLCSYCMPFECKIGVEYHSRPIDDDSLYVNEKGDILTPQNRDHLIECQKITVDYDRETNRHAKFHADLSIGGFSTNG